MRWSTRQLLEDEDQLRTGSFLHPGTLRLCPEIIQFSDSCGEEQAPQRRSFAAGFPPHYVRVKEVRGTHPAGHHSPSSRPAE